MALKLLPDERHAPKNKSLVPKGIETDEGAEKHIYGAKWQQQSKYSKLILKAAEKYERHASYTIRVKTWFGSSKNCLVLSRFLGFFCDRGKVLASLSSFKFLFSRPPTHMDPSCLLQHHTRFFFMKLSRLRITSL